MRRPYALTEEQKQKLSSVFSDTPGLHRNVLPILCDSNNRLRVDPEDAIRFHIYRDKWEGGGSGRVAASPALRYDSSRLPGDRGAVPKIRTAGQVRDPVLLAHGTRVDGAGQTARKGMLSLLVSRQV